MSPFEDVKVDALGNVVLALAEIGKLEKLDCTGSSLWSKSLTADVRKLAVDTAGAIFLTGSFQGMLDFGGGVVVSAPPSGAAMFVAKLDSSGNGVWAKSYAGSSLTAMGVDVNAMGNVYVSARATGPVDFGGGSIGGANGGWFALELDPTGAHVWSKLLGDCPDQGVLALDPSSNVLLCYADMPKDFGGTSLPLQSLVVGKLDAAGNHLWSKAIQTNGGMCKSIAADSTGAVVVSGMLLGGGHSTIDFGGGPVPISTSSAMVAKLGATGSYVFAMIPGPTDITGVASPKVAVDAANNVWITGTLTTDPLDFGSGPVTTATPVSWDPFAVELGPTGSVLWSKAYDVTTSSVTAAIAVDPSSGKALIAGDYAGTIDFGDGAIPTATSPMDPIPSGAFLAKLAP